MARNPDNFTDHLPVKMIPRSSIVRGLAYHSSLSDSQLNFVREIQQALAEVSPGSLEKWEHDLVHNMHPNREIAIWLGISRAYTRLSAKHTDPAARKDIYNILVCTTIGYKPHQITVDLLSHKQARRIMESFKSKERKDYPKTWKAIDQATGKNESNTPLGAMLLKNDGLIVSQVD